MDHRSSLLRQILEIPEMLDAIAVALQDETEKTLKDLRSAARTGNPVDSALIEGRLLAFEQVPELLKRFAFPPKQE